MYWLVFYNGVDKPDVECAFGYTFMVLEYVKKFIDSDCISSYTVFIAGSVQAVPLNKFIEDQSKKEFNYDL